MAAAFGSISSDVVASDADTSLDPAMPSGLAAGDRMVAIGVCNVSKTITPPSGWTQEANDADASYRVYLWTRTATSGDVSSWASSWAIGSFSGGAVAIIRVTGASEDALTQSLSTGPNNTVQTCPTITTPAADCLAIWGVYRSASGAATADKGTERLDVTQAGGSICFALYTASIASAGSLTGAAITTAGAFGAKRIMSVAVSPSGGAAAVASRLPLLGVG